MSNIVKDKICHVFDTDKLIEGQPYILEIYPKSKPRDRYSFKVILTSVDEKTIYFVSKICTRLDPDNNCYEFRYSPPIYVEKLMHNAIYGWIHLDKLDHCEFDIDLYRI